VADENPATARGARRSGPKHLIIRLSAIGDVLFALPAVRALRRARPDAHITWLTEDRAEDLVECVAEIDHRIVFPRRRFVAGLRSPWRFVPTLLEIARFFRALRRERYDVSLDFQGNLKSGLAVAAAGAPRRIGFCSEDGREWNDRFQSERVRMPASVRHRMDKDVALLQPLGVEPPAELDFRLDVPEREREAARAFFGSISGGRPRIVLHPSTSVHGAFKRWSPSRFAELGDRLHREHGATIVITFGPAERAIAEDVSRRMSEPAWIAPRCESLLGLAAVLAEADLVVGADTGPIHLAEAAGARVVIVFGPKDAAVYGPRSPKSVAVHTAVPCSPCRRRSCPRAFCMEFVTVDQVAAACRAALGIPRS
jgi:heptosyltransferase-1